MENNHPESIIDNNDDSDIKREQHKRQLIFDTCLYFFIFLMSLGGLYLTYKLWMVSPDVLGPLIMVQLFAIAFIGACSILGVVVTFIAFIDNLNRLIVRDY